MYSQDKNVLANLGNEHPWICLANRETDISKRARKGIIPLSPRLLQSVKRFAKPLYDIGVGVVSGWSMHVNFLIIVQFAIEISCIEIETFDFPVVACGDSEDGAETR